MIIASRKSYRKLLIPLLLMTMLLTVWLGAVGAKYVGAAQTPELPTFAIPPITQAAQDSPLPNVIVVATGGTLAGKATDATSFQSYRAGTFLMEDLLAQIPNKERIADVASYQFGNKGSGGYTIKELYDLSLAVDAALKVYDSAVVTTGTDTMEEIAYFLDLTVRSEKPVVVTGAMRPWDVVGTDGPANLYNAIKLAASGKTKWFGTVVMLNDVIHAAREVTKSNALRMDTFDSPQLGALGFVDEKVVRIYRLTARALQAGKSSWATPFDLRKVSKDSLPPVEIVYNYQEAGGGAIRGLVAEGARGIVTAGTGAGGISAQMSAARTAAIRDQGVIFVSTTRTGSGNVYGGGNGIIAGDNLNPQHARILLLLSLTFTDQFHIIKNWFETIGTQDISIQDPLPTVSPTVTPSSTPGATPTEGANTGGLGPAVTPQPTDRPSSMPTATPSPSPSPSPVPSPKLIPKDAVGHWAEMGIQKAIEAGIVSGYPDGSFKPDQRVTRAEFLVMLMNALKPEGDGSDLGFKDEAEIGLWAKRAVALAVQQKLITGYPDGSFRPNAPITRVEMVAILVKALPLEQSHTWAGGAGFTDDREIPAWAKEAVTKVSNIGIIKGRDGRFEPYSATTRAEAITVIIRLLEKK